MTKSLNYSDQINSPKWQKKRLDILNLHGFKCEKCGNEDKQLHVHHTRYIKGRKAWEYDNDIFEVLCCDCHEKEHKQVKEKQVVGVVSEKYIGLIKSFDKIKLSERSIFYLRETIGCYNELGYFNTVDDLIEAIFCCNSTGMTDDIIKIINDKNKLDGLEITVSIMSSQIEKMEKIMIEKGIMEDYKSELEENILPF